MRPLNDPELGAERRAAIEAAIARGGRPRGAGGVCRTTPGTSSAQGGVRIAARVLAATEGPVGEEAVELAEVSRRSPLAPWKLLVRAIACFYRGEDEACRRYLEAIKPESAPARLVPAMRAMLGDEAGGVDARGGRAGIVHNLRSRSAAQGP